MCHRAHLSFNTSSPKLFSSTSATKILAWKEPPAKPPRPWGGFKNDDDDDDAESQTSTLPEQPTAALAGDVAKLARERALRNPGLFSADGLFAPTEEPDFEFDGDGELDELTSADFGEDPYLHVDT